MTDQRRIASENEVSQWEKAVRLLLNDPASEDLVRECYFDQPTLQAAERYSCSPEWQAVKTFLPSRVGHALDVGAGNGIASYALVKEGWMVTATEPDPSQLVGRGAIKAWSDEIGGDVEVFDCLCEQLPFDHNTFDFIFARQVMHHTSDLRAAFQELRRVLKPDGIMISARDHVVSSSRQLERFFEIHPLHKYYGGENAFSEKEYLTAARLGGLKVQKILRSFDSEINLAPYSTEDLAERISELFPIRIGNRMLRAGAAQLLRSAFLTRLLSRIDRRPGRLLTLIATTTD